VIANALGLTVFQLFDKVKEQAPLVLGGKRQRQRLRDDSSEKQKATPKDGFCFLVGPHGLEPWTKGL